MEFKIRNMENLIENMDLENVGIELAAHRKILPKITKQILKRKVEHNISLLQCRKVELLRASFPKKVG